MNSNPEPVKGRWDTWRDFGTNPDEREFKNAMAICHMQGHQLEYTRLDNCMERVQCFKCRIKYQVDSGG